ncbi:hypothetical protein Psch_00099 [Pelotomaculum schinkii]|uniref:Uncharacterized protein n=1 Tax=Pelotomaculum schinkii TaxID=78350 RepID=A0A4Y7RE18_9FIRM|nr:hypothetical protein [Pelotomaculum schinkii]TEB06567.1 hypothetical protein Psch_00099 [Pelotomaculum schinkii]
MSEGSGVIRYGILSAVMDYYQNVPSGIETAHTRHFQGRGDESMPMQRLGRALSNACDSEAKATYSRFAIWGADINTIAHEAIDAVSVDNKKVAMQKLSLILKNMRAFIDCFSLLDSQPGYMQFETAADILTEIKQRMEDTKENKAPQYEDIYMRICDALKNEDFIETGEQL